MTTALSSIVSGWFSEKFTSPTPVQKATWAAAAEGNHLLAVAPTGSGKTLAAFLVALDRLFANVGKASAEESLRILYISPLKALGTDIRENLVQPLQELKERYELAGLEVPEIRIGIRNGDTPPAERRRQIKTPPQILITTPESLGILLLSETGRQMLSTVETCIIDEIHAVAPDRRGTLLVCHLERLADLAGDFQRIGLTATVNPIERAASFLGGFKLDEVTGELVSRYVKIVAPPAIKKIDIQVESLPTPPESETPDPDAFWREIAERIRDGLKDKRSTLAFLDSRKWTEKLARLINENSEEPLAWAHHGSLSKDMRRLVERRLKDGTLKAVVATGSLELGIDIGRLDEVLLMGSPVAPSKALQRAGRAGHRPDETSHARIFPIHPPDMLAATVMAGMAGEGLIEDLRIPVNPLDILAQLMVAICTERGRSEDELWQLIRRCWSFRNLPRKSFNAVLAMLRGRFAETRLPALKPVLYLDTGLLVARPGMRMRLYSGGGAIPDLGMYGVRQQGVDGVIGALDEKFVWESQEGMVFFLGNRRWRIVSIGDRDITVVPTEEPESTEPFWRAEGGSRDPEFSRRIADLLESAESCLAGNDGRQVETMLAEDHHLAALQAEQLGRYFRDQRRRTQAPLPHRHHIMIESAVDPDAGDQPGSRSLFIHTFLGGRINRPLALALQAAWAAKSPVPITPTATDDTIVFTINQNDLESIESVFRNLGDPEVLIRRVLESTPLFGGRFRESAGRALLLPASTPRRRQPLWMTRQRSRALMEAVAGYPDFPIMTEVWRTCLNDEFAMEALDEFLADLTSGRIAVSVIHTKAPSPFTGTAVRRRLAGRMTANMRDQGDSRLVSNLEVSEIRRLSRAGTLRPRIPEELATKLDRRRRRIETGYAPGSIEAFKAWIAEREAFNEADWIETLDAVSIETGLSVLEIKKGVSGSVRSALLGPGSASWYIAVEAADEWESAFPAGDSLNTDYHIDAGEVAALAVFWLSGRGPVDVPDLLRRFGFEEDNNTGEEFLEALSGMDEKITLDCITGPSSSVPEVSESRLEACDSDGMEILLRWRRRQSRNSDSPLPVQHLAGFLAGRQRLAQPEAGEDTVQDALSLLEGIPLPASSWEQSVLPARMASYRSRDLDALVSREEMIWVGAGEGRIAWLSAEGGWRYPTPESEESPDEADGPFPFPGDAPRDFWKIAELMDCDSGTTTAAIWNEVWRGRLTTSDSAVLRRGINAGFKAEKINPGNRRIPGGIRGWAAGRPISGRWYAPSYADPPEDPMASDLLMREQIQLLAGRFGILSRPLLEREIPPWRWSALSRTLGLMELGDELIGGRWFEGLPMPQFMLPEALSFWRDGAIPGRPWCLEAIDPASPCGIAGDRFLPSRRQGTWLGWNEEGSLTWILKSGGKSLEYFGTSGSGIKDIASLDMMAGIITERDFNPRNRLVISKVNAVDIEDSGLGNLLEKTGFIPTGNGEMIRRARPVGMR